MVKGQHKSSMGVEWKEAWRQQVSHIKNVSLFHVSFHLDDENWLAAQQFQWLTEAVLHSAPSSLVLSGFKIYTAISNTSLIVSAEN